MGPSPQGGRKQQQHGEDLQPPRQHIKAQKQIGPRGKETEIPGGAHHVQSRADVIDAGHNRGKGCQLIKARQTQQQP